MPNEEWGTKPTNAVWEVEGVQLCLSTLAMLLDEYGYKAPFHGLNPKTGLRWLKDVWRIKSRRLRASDPDCPPLDPYTFENIDLVMPRLLQRKKAKEGSPFNV